MRNGCGESNYRYNFTTFTGFIYLRSLPAIHRYTHTLSWYNYSIFPYITKWVYAIALTAQTGSIYCTLAVTVERYIVICWSLR